MKRWLFKRSIREAQLVVEQTLSILKDQNLILCGKSGDGRKHYYLNANRMNESRKRGRDSESLNHKKLKMKNLEYQTGLKAAMSGSPEERIISHTNWQHLSDEPELFNACLLRELRPCSPAGSESDC